MKDFKEAAERYAATFINVTNINDRDNICKDFIAGAEYGYSESVKEVSREGENQTEDGKDIILRVAMELGAVFQIQFVEDDGNTWTTPVNLTPERLKRLDDISIRKIRIEFKA